jgi:hypothetical protein
VRLEVAELGGADLLLPLTAQLVEDRFTGAQDLEAERGDLKAHAAGVAGVCAAGHVPAFLQDRDGFRRCLLGDRQAAAQFGGVAGACGDGPHGEVMDGAHILVAAAGQLGCRGVHQ